MYIKVEEGQSIFPFKDFNESHQYLNVEGLAELGIYKVEVIDNRVEGKDYEVGEPYFENGWKVSYVETGNMSLDLDLIAKDIRKERDRRIEKEVWKYERNARELRLGLIPTDNIAELDVYIQALADITTQETFPLNIKWPEKPE
jgi:hypothetical protein